MHFSSIFFLIFNIYKQKSYYINKYSEKLKNKWWSLQLL